MPNVHRLDRAMSVELQIFLGRPICPLAGLEPDALLDKVIAKKKATMTVNETQESHHATAIPGVAVSSGSPCKHNGRASDLRCEPKSV